MTERYKVDLSRSARRVLEEDLPEGVAAAAIEFITGPLSVNPYRVGKRLRAPLADTYVARRGDYRVLYKILGSRLIIEVITITHRRDVYHR